VRSSELEREQAKTNFVITFGWRGVVSHVLEKIRFHIILKKKIFIVLKKGLKMLLQRGQ
jgi:hypothetical protein